MADNEVTMTFGAGAAKNFNVSASLVTEIKLTRRFIWLMKLKYIWAVIRADMRHDHA